MKLILTCEHGGNQIPLAYKAYFKEFESVLLTHRGYDLGALDTFNHLQALSSFSMYSKTSRLLVELNRSLHHKNLFSEVSKQFSIEQKKQILAQYYFPYRKLVEQAIRQTINNKETVLHISIHSFTPVLHNNTRNCDMGILYDSRVQQEQVFAKQLKTKINYANPDIKVRYNYPYLGKMDGFTTYLRKQFQNNYMGIELEINQKFSKKNTFNKKIKKTIYKALEAIINES